MGRIRVAIVDDQKLFRQSLAVLINTVDEFELVIEAGDGQTLIEKLLPNPYCIDVAIIDLDMPGMNGIELNELLHKLYPHIKVIILSVHVQERFITQAIAGGAAGYLAKNCDKDELTQAINAVYTSGFYFNADVLKDMQGRAGNKFTYQKSIEYIPVKLTERETQLLNLICKEYSNAEIAKELYLSVRTVEGHRNNLIAKIGCRNTAGVVLFAVKNNLFKGLF